MHSLVLAPTLVDHTALQCRKIGGVALPTNLREGSKGGKASLEQVFHHGRASCDHESGPSPCRTHRHRENLGGLSGARKCTCPGIFNLDHTKSHPYTRSIISPHLEGRDRQGGVIFAGVHKGEVEGIPGLAPPDILETRRPLPRINGTNGFSRT